MATSRLLKKLQMQGAQGRRSRPVAIFTRARAVTGAERTGSYVSTGSAAATQQMGFFSSLLQGMPD